MTYDFHSHFLPGIDDGARDIEESVQILDIMAENGVDVICATPHFYCSEQNIDDFLKKRNNAYEKLVPYLKPNHPKIFLGAEVLYDNALVGYEGLNRLCLQNTEYLLLEMPYIQLKDRIITGVDEIANSGDVKLIIAHIERYLNFTSMNELEKLMNLDVLGQINAKSLTKFSSRRSCLKLAKKGYVQFIGSDYHRIGRGDVTVNNGIEILNNKLGNDYNEIFSDNSEAVLKNCSMEHFYG